MIPDLRQAGMDASYVDLADLYRTPKDVIQKAGAAIQK